MRGGEEVDRDSEWSGEAAGEHHGGAVDFPEVLLEGDDIHEA